MQLRHFHLLSADQTLQLLAVTGSFALAHLLAQLVDVYAAVDADAI